MANRLISIDTAKTVGTQFPVEVQQEIVAIAGGVGVGGGPSGGLAATDNGDGTMSVTGVGVVDNGDGTITVVEATSLVFTTALRPAAVSAGNGAQIYDDTLNIPIWSDGTVWRNATGTAV